MSPIFDENGQQLPDEAYVAYMIQAWGYSEGKARQLIAIENGLPDAGSLLSIPETEDEE